MSQYRWGSDPYPSGESAAFACCEEWICGASEPRNAVARHVADFDAEAFAADCLDAWKVATPGGRDPEPEDDATSLLDDWGVSRERFTAIMGEAMASLLRQVAQEIEDDA